MNWFTLYIFLDLDLTGQFVKWHEPIYQSYQSGNKKNHESLRICRVT